MKCAALVLVSIAHVAYAFPTGVQFDGDPLTSDGGGGIAFDGAPRFAGHTCAVCHTNAPGEVGVKLESDKPELFTDGYRPNMQYHLRVLLQHEHAAQQFAASGDNCGFNATPYHPCDENGFAIEFDDADGKPVGKLAPVAGNACATGTIPPDVDAHVLMDGTAAVHTGAHQGLTQWDLCWTAPAAKTGTVTAFVAVLDGNGGNGTIDFPNDTVGDDVAAGAVAMAEIGGDAPGTQGGGCNAATDSSALALVALVVLLARRRRRLALVLALATFAGCAHVRPRQRETLAKRKMKFSPDPAEDELDLHMQESREGSSGGYGSSGGGCGCN